jgi:hypothetical protein
MPSISVTIHPLSLRVLPDQLTVVDESGVAATRDEIDVIGIVRSPDAVTVVRPAEAGSVPAAAWRAFYAEAGHALDLPGVLVGVLAPLANAGVEVFVLSTIDRDLVLVPADRVPDAVDALRLAGHTVAPVRDDPQA